MRRTALWTAAEAKVRAQTFIREERAEWAPLKPSTVEEKHRLGYGYQVADTDPLLRTGHMRASIGSEVVLEGVWNHAVVGATDSVAAKHELGTSRVPPRPFLAMAMVELEPLVTRRLELAFSTVFAK